MTYDGIEHRIGAPIFYGQRQSPPLVFVRSGGVASIPEAGYVGFDVAQGVATPTSACVGCGASAYDFSGRCTYCRRQA